jgi:16S rRNA (cytosine967-C5)-methyltransferase
LAPLLQLQKEIVEGALKVLNPGGFLGYATCSPHYAETTAQVRSMLKDHPELELIDITEFLPEGLHNATRDGALALWGHIHNTDSMYLALLKKMR